MQWSAVVIVFVFAARLGTTILLQKLYSFFKTFFSNCYFKKNICKSHQNSEKRFWRKVLEKGNNKNRCNLVPSSEWLFNLIFVSFLVTTESNGRNLNCRYHTKLLLSINNVVYSILPTYFTLKKNIRTLYFEAISEKEIVHTLNTLCFSQSKWVTKADCTWSYSFKLFEKNTI